MPALCAGLFAPPAVSTCVSPATMTPFVPTCMPTACPPTTSSCAEAVTVSAEHVHRQNSTVINAFFISLYPPRRKIFF